MSILEARPTSGLGAIINKGAPDRKACGADSVTQLLRYRQDTQRIRADDRSASVCGPSAQRLGTANGYWLPSNTRLIDAALYAAIASFSVREKTRTLQRQSLHPQPMRLPLPTKAYPVAICRRCSLRMGTSSPF